MHLKVHEFVLRVAVADDEAAPRVLERVRDCTLDLCGDPRDQHPGRVQAKLVALSTIPAGADALDLEQWYQDACRVLGKDEPAGCFEEL